ncbi:hypothetical protein Dimus_030175 [Dionaea muscipula]
MVETSKSELKRNQPGRTMEERSRSGVRGGARRLVEEFVETRRWRTPGRQSWRMKMTKLAVMEDEDDREGSGGRSSAGQGWQTTEQVEEEEAEQVDDEDHGSEVEEEEAEAGGG